MNYESNAKKSRHKISIGGLTMSLKLINEAVNRDLVSKVSGFELHSHKYIPFGLIPLGNM